MRCLPSFFFVRRDRLLQPTFPLDCLSARISAAEAAIDFHRVGGIGAAEHLVAEDLAVGAGHAAMLDEPFIGIIIKDLAPHVGIIIGLIAIAPDMQEIGAAIARRDLFHRDPVLLQGGRLEGVDVGPS